MTLKDSVRRLQERPKSACGNCCDRREICYATPGSDIWVTRACPDCTDATFACATCRDFKWLDPPPGFSSRGWGRRCPDCNRATLKGLPVPFATVRLPDVRPLQGNATALRFAQSFGTSGRDLMLTGPVGVGKTMLAAAIGNAACDRADRPIGWFVRWPHTLVQLLPGGTDTHLLNTLCETPLLVLDDLGAEQASDFARRTAYIVYEARGDKGLRTVITSNLGLPQLAKFFGDDRLTSRLAGRADVVLVEGPDQRLEQGKVRLG